MALPQQLARVSPAYLDRCRRNAAGSPDGDPRWDPPAGDLLDLDWALWGLLRHLRAVEAAPATVALLDRSISGDDAAAVAFLDHLEVYDRFGDPPTLLTPHRRASANTLRPASSRVRGPGTVGTAPNLVTIGGRPPCTPVTAAGLPDSACAGSWFRPA
ncbi:hypothetical protein [Kitasatospora sp. NPDC093679]|uniref:hypothetical protein n=1 Tax=Kitasatospora sp. NPDC093679 TaxID=3154983 RepID=UPI003414740F